MARLATSAFDLGPSPGGFVRGPTRQRLSLNEAALQRVVVDSRLAFGLKARGSHAECAGPQSARQSWLGLFMRGPGTTIVLVVRADCSLERS